MSITSSGQRRTVSNCSCNGQSFIFSGFVPSFCSKLLITRFDFVNSATDQGIFSRPQLLVFACCRKARSVRNCSSFLSLGRLDAFHARPRCIALNRKEPEECKDIRHPEAPLALGSYVPYYKDILYVEIAIKSIEFVGGHYRIASRLRLK